MRSISLLSIGGVLCMLVPSLPAPASAPCRCGPTQTPVTARTRTYRAGQAERSAEAPRVSTRAFSEILIPSGTVIPVRLAESLDTKWARPGTRFMAHVAAPVVIHNGVVIPRGAVCRGHLVESKPSGRLRGRAVMRLALDTIHFRGRRYSVITSGPVFVSKSHKRRNLALIGGGAGGGAAIGAIAGDGIGAAIGAGAGAVAGTVGAVVTGKRNLRLAPETLLDFTLRRPVHMRV